MVTSSNMGRSWIKFVFLIYFGSLSGYANTDLFVGDFIAEVEGKTYRLSIEPAVGKKYDGILVIDEEPMQVQAHRFGERLGGRIIGKSSSFGFRAQLQGAAPLLHTETGLTIRFRRDSHKSSP